MKDYSEEFKEDAGIESEAADWTLRLDRGITAEEQDRYTQWLAQDVRHRRAMALYQRGWSEFDRLSGLRLSDGLGIDPDLLDPQRHRRPRSFFGRRGFRFGFAGLCAAGVIFAGFILSRPPPGVQEPIQLADNVGSSLATFTRVGRFLLEDGSQIELNRGARVEVNFTPGERQVRLVGGEASFRVTKDPARPFIVETHGLRFRALGTVFNVRALAEGADLIVSEGLVRVEAGLSSTEASGSSYGPVLARGQRTTVRGPAELPRLEVIDLKPDELEEALLWQPRMLDFDTVPLNQIAAEFNRRNSVKLTVADADLQELALSCSFWSDNVEGFVRLMVSSFGMHATRRGNEIVLTEAP